MVERYHKKIEILSIEERIVHYEEVYETIVRGVKPYECIAVTILKDIVSLRKEKIKRDHCE